MPTRADVSTASILVRGPLERVREVVVRQGREAWIAPAGEGWVLVLPDHPAPPGTSWTTSTPTTWSGWAGRSVTPGWPRCWSSPSAAGSA